VLKACIVQNSKNDLSEHDVHCRQRFEDHDDVQLVKSFNVFVIIVAIIVIIVVVVVIVFVVSSSLFVVSIVSI
jgi:t-SNARE complex subunit (syntaxin)